MTRWILLPDFGDAGSDAVDEWMRAARATVCEPAVRSSDIARDLPDSFGGGDAVWDLESTVDPTLIPAVAALLARRGPLRACSRVAVEPVATRHVDLAGPRIRRTLLLRVREGTDTDVVRRFERSLVAMPDHIPAIAGWSLGRVVAARSDGDWTHAWEQEFADLQGLRRGYLRADYHLTAVERWFDPEIPGAIVDPAVAHLVRAADGPGTAADQPDG